MKTSTTYDSYGNALTGTIQENSSSPLIKTETEYTANGNYVVKQKDARGNEVTNTLDTNGKVLSVTDPDNQEVEYTYDSSNRVTKVETVYPVGGVDRTSKNEYTYENDRIKTVAHNTASDNASDVRYTFNYDSLGRKTSVTVSNGSPNATEQVLSTNVYSNDRKSLLDEVQYGNGGKVKYSYDEYDRVTGITHDSDTNPKFAYEYDSRGRAAVVTDTRDGSVIRNNYDQSDRPAESEQRDGNGDLKYRTLINYDIKNRVKDLNEATGNGTHKTEYAYDKDNRATEVKYNNNANTKVTYTYDKLNRITSRKTTNSVEYNTQYGYVQGASAYGNNATTPLVASITQGSGANAFSLAYTYDSRGNITSETRNNVTTTYEYDALGQLVRVNDPWDNTIAIETQDPQYNGTTWIYVYDRGGNILSKTAYEFTTGTVGTAVRTYLYGYTDTNWKDKLTSFDNSTITYDAIGNPLSDGTWTYVWQAGRQLKSMSRTEGSDTITVEFEYDHAGLRTKKTRKVNNVITEETEYILNGKNVVELIHTAYPENSDPVVNVLHFYYDAQGRAAMVKYNGVMYGYVHDLQGDVIGILDNTGSKAVEYKYDAWGRPLSVTGTLAETLGILNPFRYRGYVFDDETQLYYLRSRYYNPDVGRFVSTDKLIIGGIEPEALSYSYTHNNPIRFSDNMGLSSEDSTLYCYHAVHEAGEGAHGHGEILLKFAGELTILGNECTQYMVISYGGIDSIVEGQELTLGVVTLYTNAREIRNYYNGKDVAFFYVGSITYSEFNSQYEQDCSHLLPVVNAGNKRLFFPKGNCYYIYDFDESNCQCHAIMLGSFFNQGMYRDIMREYQTEAIPAAVERRAELVYWERMEAYFLARGCKLLTLDSIME